MILFPKTLMDEKLKLLKMAQELIKYSAGHYKFSSITTYQRTKAYKTRVKEHKKWFQEYNK